jgi:hypothetical protein
LIFTLIIWLLFPVLGVLLADIATPTSTTQIPTPTHTPSPTLSPNLVLYDDFNGGHIDESNWMLPTNENLIYQADGVLNFVSPQSA